MKLLWSLLALFAALGVCQDANQQDQLARALELLQQMPECAVRRPQTQYLAAGPG